MAFCKIYQRFDKSFIKRNTFLYTNFLEKPEKFLSKKYTEPIFISFRQIAVIFIMKLKKDAQLKNIQIR